MRNKLVKLKSLNMVILFFLMSFVSAYATDDGGEQIIGTSCIQLNNRTEDIVTAKNMALSDLAAQIQCNVNSEFLHYVTETSNSSFEYTKSKLSVLSNLKLEGIRFKVSVGKKVVTARAILNKKEAKQIYFEKTKNLKERLFSSFKRINDLIYSNEKSKAFQEIHSASRLFDQIEQNIIVYISLGGEEISSLRNEISRAELDDKLRLLRNKDIHTIEDAAISLSFILSEEFTQNEKIIIFPFNYENTQFGSQFSGYFQKKMIDAFFLSQKISIVKESAGKMFNGSRLYGNYWVKGDTIEIITTLYDSLGISSGSAQISFPKNIVSGQNINMAPQNINFALKEDMLFSKQSSAYGNMNFYFWTNHGNENPYFSEGDSVKFFIQVDEPCYISIIYHLANGIRSPLYENFYVGMAQVNQVLELPYEAVCYPPFGIEKIQAFASSEKMPAINLTQTTIEGITYKVLAEDLDTFLSRTRGLILNSSKYRKRAERIITVTTTKKF